MTDAALLERLDVALGEHGLATRGVVVDSVFQGSSGTCAAASLRPGGHLPRGGDRLVSGASDDEDGKTIVLVGHAGSSIWPHFSAWRRETPDGGGADPLDRWSRRVLDVVADQFGARAILPSDRPYLPFQRWAMEAEGLRPSPLGILIHPRSGLWHAYRGALAFDRVLDRPPKARADHPCDSCGSKPCLAACPVSAFGGGKFDVARCRGHLKSPAGSDCAGGGCLARRACPVGREYAYGEEQQRFHMAAFAAAG